MYQFCQELAGDTLRPQASGMGQGTQLELSKQTSHPANCCKLVLLPGLRTRLASLREG